MKFKCYSNVMAITCHVLNIMHYITLCNETKGSLQITHYFENVIIYNYITITPGLRTIGNFIRVYTVC